MGIGKAGKDNSAGIENKSGLPLRGGTRTQRKKKGENPKGRSNTPEERVKKELTSSVYLLKGGATFAVGEGNISVPRFRSRKSEDREFNKGKTTEKRRRFASATGYKLRPD